MRADALARIEETAARLREQRDLAAVAHKPAPEPLQALDVHELAVVQFKPRTMILDPWLHAQDLVMVFAARGIGKTHFALALAYAVATGGRFCKWIAAAPAKVLYLDGELPGATMQERLLMHCPEQEPAPGFLRVFTPDLLHMDTPMPDLSRFEGQEAVEEMIEPDTSLVIVDNLSAWARSGRENEAESWAPMADWILSLRRRGMAVVLVHHAGKGGQQRGTSKREDLLDVVIGLSRPNDYEPSQGAVFVAEFTKARNLAGEGAESLELQLHTEGERATWTWRTLEASTYERVLQLAREGFKPNEMASELDVNKSTVSRHLRKARELGDLNAEGKNQ